MHLNEGTVPEDYQAYLNRKVYWIIAGILLSLILFVTAISVGAVAIPPFEVIQSLIGTTTSLKWDRIIWNIRLPQAHPPLPWGYPVPVPLALLYP
jgi:iron complex transport system permease protein